MVLVAWARNADILYYWRVEAADKIEAESKGQQEADMMSSGDEPLNETITEVLHKAGRHMEDTIGAIFIVFYTP